MSDDMWVPGVTRDPGLNAGYRLGKSAMDRMTAHDTVGHDSRAIGRNGYMQLLVHQNEDREGGCTQYAELDSICWHSYEPYRLWGPGVEFERMTTGGINDEGLSNFEDLTPNQIEWGKRIISHCRDLGIPVDLYSGGRFQTEGFRGWVNHHDVDPSRSDGLTRAEWNLLVVSELTPQQEGSLMWGVYYGNTDGSITFIHGIGAVVAFKLTGAPVAPYGLPMAELDYIKFDFNGITTKMVSPLVANNLEKASAKLLV